MPAEDQDGPFWRRNLAFNQLYLSVYHLNDRTLPRYIDALERFDPELIVGYTSAVHRLATHLLDVGQVGRVRPKVIMVSSETLTPSAQPTWRPPSAATCRTATAWANSWPTCRSAPRARSTSAPSTG
ncbi:MAG: hypothetical protein R2711_09445 [Acidimicrobiales bacterium]